MTFSLKGLKTITNYQYEPACGILSLLDILDMGVFLLFVVEEKITLVFPIKTDILHRSMLTSLYHFLLVILCSLLLIKALVVATVPHLQEQMFCFDVLSEVCVQGRCRWDCLTWVGSRTPQDDQCYAVSMSHFTERVLQCLAILT